MTALIDIRDVSLRFHLYHNPSPTMKESVVSIFQRQKYVTAEDYFFALNDINLTIHSGERVGIIGLNGAGKSTILKVIAGIYPPSKGEVEIQGKITPMIELGTGIDPELSGRENIFINGAMLGFSKNEMKSHEQAVIDFSELADFIDMPLKYYSSGMFSRLVFSIATMINPEILLLDEVFSAGDAHFVEKGTRRMEQLLDQSQIVLFVSHTFSLVERLCSRVIVLDHGRVVNDGKTKEMIEFYKKNLVQ
jgi:ABC-type polysaccharide/polyol phosphate transport system ATPase subunit